MKKLIIISALVATVGINFSCTDNFFEIEPQGAASLTSLSNKNGVNALLIGTYSLMDGVGAGNTGRQSTISNYVFGGITSGDAVKGTDIGDQPEQEYIEQFVWLSVIVDLFSRHSPKELHMRLTTKGRFAVTAMIDLALRQNNGPVTLAAISQRQQISLSYLEQLFGKLRRHDLVESTRGPGGGYTLGRKASDITVAEIVGEDEYDVRFVLRRRCDRSETQRAP